MRTAHSSTAQAHAGSFPRTVMTLLAALAMIATVAPAADAAKPSGNSDGTCIGLNERETTTFDEVRAAIGADATTLTGAGVGVAVIDTGVNEVAGLQGQVTEGIDLSFDSDEDNLRGYDLHGHGTAMASIVASRGVYGGDGIAPGAEIIDVKVGAGNGAVDVSQVIAAIDWVVANRDEYGIDVISLSYGTDGIQSHLLDPLSHAVESAWRNGIVVVVAGGNDGRSVGRLANPAVNPYVIAVGAAEQSRRSWTVPTWSSTGDGTRNPDLVAPGSAILSGTTAGSFLPWLYPSAVCLSETALHLRGSGTSQAAAVVAGSVALLLEQRPDLTPDEVKYILTSSAVDLGRNATQQGHGMIDLDAALATATPVSTLSFSKYDMYSGMVYTVSARQSHRASTGLGTLHAARGSMLVGDPGDQLTGEWTAFGARWDPTVWAPLASSGSAWQDVYATDGSWAGATWSAATWSGATWSGATWSGATWSGATWSGATWSGATWSGATWSGATWSGATWSGATWSGATWSGNGWSGASWTGASWT